MGPKIGQTNARLNIWPEKNGFFQSISTASSNGQTGRLQWRCGQLIIHVMLLIICSSMLLVPQAGRRTHRRCFNLSLRILKTGKHGVGEPLRSSRHRPQTGRLQLLDERSRQARRYPPRSSQSSFSSSVNLSCIVSTAPSALLNQNSPASYSFHEW